MTRSAPEAATLSVDRIFIVLAAVSLVAGVSLGVYMGVSDDHALAPVHVHLNLMGWASLALFGLTYRAYPGLARTRLAVAHLALSGSSGLLFPFGLYMAFGHGRAEWVGAPALMWLAGAVLFLAQMLRRSPPVHGRDGGPDP